MGITAEENLVYYVSDMISPSSSRHLRKMDAGREIAEYICREMHNARLIKYTEYNRERISARSVGIVFPAYIWGCSLGVYSFLQQLRGRIGKDTYVYAVAVGESLSGSVFRTIDRRMHSLEEFRRIFVKCGLGTEEDIYVRCIDGAVSMERGAGIERSKRKSVENLKYILSALLFCDMKALSTDSRLSGLQYIGELSGIASASGLMEDMDADLTESVPEEHGAVSVFTPGKRKLENVFLDESMLSGVRMCRVM